MIVGGLYINMMMKGASGKKMGFKLISIEAQDSGGKAKKNPAVDKMNKDLEKERKEKVGNELLI